MSDAPRGRIAESRAEPLPRLRTPAELDAVVREFAGRVERLERELADLRRLVGALVDGAADPVGAPAQLR